MSDIEGLCLCSNVLYSERMTRQMMSMFLPYKGNRTHRLTKCAVSFVRNSPGDTIISVVKAANAFTNPAPCCAAVCRGSPSVWLLPTSCAVVSKRVLAVVPTSALLPLTPNNRADTPAINGVAIDVPDSTAKLPSGTGNVERMFPPGAEMAGLRNMSLVGPKEVKLEMRPPAASGNWKSAPLWGKESDTLSPAANALASYANKQVSENVLIR